MFLKRSTHTKATFFLGSFYFLLSVYALQTYIVDGGYLNRFGWFFLWPLIPYNAICIPIYYYFQIVFKDRLHWHWTQIVLFVPLILALIDVGYVYLQPASVYTDILNGALADPNKRLKAGYLLLDLNQHVLMRHLWQLGVLLVLLPELLKFIKLGREDRLKGILNKWLSVLWTILFAMANLILLYVAGKMTGYEKDGQLWGMVTLTLYLALFFLGIVPIYFPSILYGYPKVGKRVPASNKGPGKQVSELKYGLDQGQITTKLELLNRKKRYLDQNFDLTKCAQEMEMPAHHISYFLKSRYGLSFSSYRNGLRMEHAKGLIGEGYLKHNTIEALAAECGFASRTSFSQAFKNTTQVSPSQYAQNGN